MISNREVALSILKGKRYLAHVKQATQAGSITTEQLEKIAHAHNIHPEIFTGMVIAGVLDAYRVDEDTKNIESQPEIILEPGKKYLVYFKEPLDDAFCFYMASGSLLLFRVEAYERFCKTYRQPSYSHCVRCGLIIPQGKRRFFCSEKCAELHRVPPFEQAEKQQAKSDVKPNEKTGLLTCVKNFFKSIPEFFKSI